MHICHTYSYTKKETKAAPGFGQQHSWAAPAGDTCHGEYVPVSDLHHSTEDAVFQGSESG